MVDGTTDITVTEESTASQQFATELSNNLAQVTEQSDEEEDFSGPGQIFDEESLNELTVEEQKKQL